jgi:hypothetical protein
MRPKDVTSPKVRWVLDRVLIDGPASGEWWSLALGRWRGPGDEWRKCLAIRWACGLTERVSCWLRDYIVWRLPRRSARKTSSAFLSKRGSTSAWQQNINTVSLLAAFLSVPFATSSADRTVREIAAFFEQISSAGHNQGSVVGRSSS